MNSGLQKKSFIFAIAALLIALCLFLVFEKKDSTNTAETKEISASQAFGSNQLIITNLAIGEADCAIIQFSNKVAIIDTGEKENYEILKSNLDSMQIERVDYLILTHYDKDHVGNVVSLLDDYSVSNIYVPDYVSSKQYYDEVQEAISDKKTYVISENTSFSTEDLYWEFYPAAPDFTCSTDNLDNNMSLVLKLSFRETSFLFCGDIEKERIDYMLDNGSDISCDWMKYPHHNLYQKSAKDFIKEASPKYVIMSYGDDPGDSEKIKKFLDKQSISYYDTSIRNVVTVSDGVSITVD